MAVYLNGSPQLIPNAEGEKETPSIVAYTAEKYLLVGTAAAEQSHYNPENTFSFAKVLLGRMPGDIKEEEIDGLSCRLDLAGLRTYYMCSAIGRALSPEDIIALILEKFVKDASAHLNGDVKRSFYLYRSTSITHKGQPSRAQRALLILKLSAS